MAEYKVNFIWDEEAAVWVATSDDVQGLVLEHGSLDVLMERVKLAAPELIELNNEDYPKQFDLLYSTQRLERVALHV